MRTKLVGRGKTLPAMRAKVGDGVGPVVHWTGAYNMRPATEIARWWGAPGRATYACCTQRHGLFVQPRGIGLVLRAATPVIGAWRADCESRSFPARGLVSFEIGSLVDDFGATHCAEVIVAASHEDVEFVVTGNGGHVIAHYWGGEVPSSVMERAQLDGLVEGGELTELGEALIIWHRLVGVGPEDHYQALVAAYQASGDEFDAYTEVDLDSLDWDDEFSLGNDWD